jgi:acetoacetyl-CoA synthetase
MQPDQELTPELVNQIKVKIRSLLSPRHVPSFILKIGDIPYTLTGKKVEIAVKKILNGENAPPGTALANPESLSLYKNIPELKWTP